VVGVIMCAALYPADIPTLVSITPTQAGVALFMVVFNTILPVVMLLEAIKRIGATLTSLVGISETPFAVLFAFIILGETLTGMQVAGSVLVVLSILMVTIPEKKKTE
ncbi:MAG: EamA family transporter, partial [Eggerthellaceae bacterium]|nr:EamA family transporter [Eggerthellaceae bacterium]